MACVRTGPAFAAVVTKVLLVTWSSALARQSALVMASVATTVSANACPHISPMIAASHPAQSIAVATVGAVRARIQTSRAFATVNLAGTERAARKKPAPSAALVMAAATMVNAHATGAGVDLHAASKSARKIALVMVSAITACASATTNTAVRLAILILPALGPPCALGMVNAFRGGATVRMGSVVQTAVCQSVPTSAVGMASAAGGAAPVSRAMWARIVA